MPPFEGFKTVFVDVKFHREVDELSWMYLPTHDPSTDGGEAGKLHPGLWKIPPRVLENSTQAF